MLVCLLLGVHEDDTTICMMLSFCTCPLLFHTHTHTLATPPPVRNQDSSCKVKVTPSSTPSSVTAQHRVDQSMQRVHTCVKSTLRQNVDYGACCNPLKLTNSSMRCFGCQVGLAALVGTDGAQTIGPLHPSAAAAASTTP